MCSGQRNGFTSSWIHWWGIISVILLYYYSTAKFKCIFDTTNCVIYSSIKSWSYLGINLSFLIFSWFVCLFIDFHVDLLHKGAKSGEWSQLNMWQKAVSPPPSIFIPFLKELRSVLAVFKSMKGSQVEERSD